MNATPSRDDLLADAGPDQSGTAGVAVLRWLGRLDRVLRVAVEAMGDLGADDPFRGLHVERDDVIRMLRHEVAAGQVTATEPSEAVDAPPALAFLRDRYGLSDFDLDILLVALAPEVDLRYQRIYAYLQDDVTKGWPTVNLALNLLCTSPADKLVRRVHFTADRPLLRHGLIRLFPEPGHSRSPLLAHHLAVDEQIVDTLLGVPGLDRRLASWCQVTPPGSDLDELPWVEPGLHTLTGAAVVAARTGRPLRLYLQGPRGSGRRTAAGALAGQAAVPLLEADLGAAPWAEPEFTDAVAVLLREAVLFGAALHVHDLDALEGDPRRGRLLALLSPAPGLIMLSGTASWVPTGGDPVLIVPFTTPDVTGRAACWRTSLSAHGLDGDPAAVDTLAAGFRLTPGQTHTAVAEASACTPGSVTLDDLRAAARAQTGQSLASLARKISPRAEWDDIVLPADTFAQLRELCQRASSRHQVLDTWGFGRKLSAGTGTTALFLGPSGTGKTFAAEIVAHELCLDLYKIDLAGVVSKYIGETEKNLDRVFTAAADANGVLFFDEAEALFGKRSEVRDSHDRYANIEVAYLLQKMEEYEGIAILATNLGHTLDEAFLRRLAFSIHFPFPDESSRRQIWAGVWPLELPVADDLDLDALAHRFTLSGGHIKNIALAAAFHAAADGHVVTYDHVLHAVRREYQKLGRDLSEPDLRIGVRS